MTSPSKPVISFYLGCNDPEPLSRVKGLQAWRQLGQAMSAAEEEDHTSPNPKPFHVHLTTTHMRKALSRDLSTLNLLVLSRDEGIYQIWAM